MKRIMWCGLSLFVVLCVVVPAVGMDKDVAGATKLLLSQTGYHVDLIDAANKLPLPSSINDESHPCTKELKDVAIELLMDQTVHSQVSCGSKAAHKKELARQKELLKECGQGVQAARYLIRAFMADKRKFEADVEQLKKSCESLNTTKDKLEELNKHQKTLFNQKYEEYEILDGQFLEDRESLSKSIDDVKVD